ncbi:MAG: hypothetical protein GY928_23245 [Colwellia sp.]|nr:hypothetical protein [Colwellia sp.]
MTTQLINQYIVPLNQEYIDHNNCIYKRDTKLRDMLNLAFSANIQMAWSNKGITKTKGEINVGCGAFVVLNQKNIMVEMSSSEWCKIKY